MSFLYEALLKKDRQTDEAAMPQNAAMHGVFADEGKSSSPTALWLALAIALLIIGVLAGYILGQQSHPQTVQYVEKPPQLSSSKNTLQNTMSEIEQSPEAVEDEPQPLLEPVGMPQSAQVVNTTETTSMQSAVADKQFEVSLDQNGNVQSSVVEDEVEVEETAEQNYISVNDQNVMDLEQVPENLRESFQLAVEATSEENQEGAYATEVPQVTNSSSLPDITELSDTDKAGLPPILYQMHIYASNKTDRWVKLNDRVMTEGEEFMPGLTLLEIRQDIIVWETRFNRFSQQALEDYSAL